MKTNKAIDIQLNKLGIYELRNLAREAGVKAPTTKRRETLIEQIKENIESGAFTPDLTKKAGRPAKRFYKVENMLTGFLTNSDSELDERLNCFDNRDSLDGYFSQSLEFDDVEDEIIDAQGILRATSKGTYYFMNNKGNRKIFVVVPPEEIRKYSLIEGDMVEGQANYIAQRNMGMMSEIQVVNSKKPKDIKPHNEPKYEIPTNGLPNFPIMEGQGLVFAADTSTFVDNMSRFVSDLTKKGYTCIGLGLELNMEQKLKLERITNLKLI
ncbi:MAG: hypothetical protein IJA69_01325, partial [Clostridia bacterium]|nr:hypothetical protein [Clostridia bacterium]